MSFLGIDPGQGSRYALRKMLESRQGDPVARYVLEHGEWFSGRVLPDQYEHLAGPMRHCHTNSLDAAQQMPSLRLMTGMYSVAPQGRDRLEWVFHSWLQDAEGVIEVTFPTVVPDGLTFDVGGSQIPWVSPDRWCYVGVELDALFVASFYAHYGLPVFDVPDGRERFLAAPYSKHPFDPARR